ncbi:VOC family protein [Paenibacillus humicola]|uniref:VOC family protein n=1 Tax=Paenibacillus humicola TaxID=3110540 RepID=UPI00237AB191|nr:VOC family protein [Paenibacillus humicola]
MQHTFGHMAIRVRDVEAAAAFYADMFGFKELFRMSDDNGKASLIAVQIANRQFLELVEGGDEPSSAGGPAAGFLHICFETGDVDAMYRSLQEKETFTDGEPRLGKSGSRFFFTRDLDGNSIEFVQILPGSLQDRAFRGLTAGA